MSEDEEPLTENEQSINNTTTEPRRPFKITMELPLFLTLLGISLSGAVVSNILLYRTCVHALHHSKEECAVFLAPERSNTTKKLEEEVQKYTTMVSVAKMVIESVGPAILSLFLGVWSDTYGRKPLVVWPLFGMSISAMLTVVYSMLDDFGPWWYILTVIPMTVTGGYTALFTGAFTYISDITTIESRSIRMTIMEAAFSAGNFLGSLSSSYLIMAVGNVFVLLINAVLNVIAYVFTNICLPESLPGALRGGFSSLMDLTLAKEMMKTCFKKRHNHGRAQILLLTLSNSLSIFILYGVLGLGYLYTREKLHWAIKEYSVYSAVNTLISVTGALIGVKLGGKILGIGDLPLAIIGYISAIAEFIVITFATKSWHMYLGSSISAFKGLSAPLIRSHITKAVPVEDIAKVFALLCAVEAICPLFSPVMYNGLYAYTISSFPGAIFLLSAGIVLICIVLLSIVQHFAWKHSATSYQTLPVEPVSND